MKNKFEQLRYYTEFKIIKESIQSLNPEFSLCTVLVAYHGDNRNKSSISKQVFDNNLWTIYGIPIIGEWVKLEEDQNKETWGSHGGRLILDSEGMKYEQTTRPFGFVTEEAYKNASWVEVLEKDGHTVHEYIKLEKCILWNSRYKEVDSILEKNFGQSMEISNIDGFYRDDGYFEISKFTYSALCILGTQVEPCFESCIISRQYEMNQFKHEVQQMMDEYKQTNQNNKKGACDMLDKIVSILSTYVFKNDIDQEVSKYIHLSTTENEVNVIDREDDYKAYAITYTVEKDEDGEVVNVVLDFDNKVEKSIDTCDKVDKDFSIKSEVDSVCASKVSFAIDGFESSIVDELNEKIIELKDKYSTLEEEHSTAKSKLEEFELAKIEAEKELHNNEIDSVVGEFEKKLNNNSEFLMYRAKLDYSKSVEQIKTDLTLILGRANLNTKKHGFSYNPTTYGIGKGFDKSNSSHSRYGDLFDKIKK